MFFGGSFLFFDEAVLGCFFVLGLVLGLVHDCVRLHSTVFDLFRLGKTVFDLIRLFSTW